ncbi:heterokaryon incompatibility protein-domain-containing protein, partial [Paraphoma chrysanthemicola]
MWLRRCVAEEDFLASNFATDDHRESTYSPPSSPSLLFPFADNGTFITESLSSRDNGLDSDVSFETPSRLLEIKDDATSIKLVETNGREIPYAALSYCWGKDDVGGWKTTMATLGSHKTVGLNVSLLPKTLQHSLRITRSLDISYIWIDALCIIQDSSEDWAKEAAKMAGVYFGSVVTIAASGARSWADGCFNKNSRRVFERGSYSNYTNTYFHGAWERYHGIFSGVAYSGLVLDSPLAKRGWTFQEHRLPRRTLYFTSDQLFWECQHCRMGEDNFPMKQKLGGHPILDSKHLTSDEAARLWYLGVVEDYSRRQLTYATDKLVAVSALAKSAHQRRPQPYIAGLWKDSILHGLMWRREGQGTKHAFQSFPSWSWATQNSAIQYLWTN